MNNQTSRYNNQIITNNQIQITKPKNNSLFDYWLLRFGIWLFLVSWLLVILVSGCAKTVTVIGAPGEEMVVEVTLRGSLDADDNRYFLVLSSNPNYRVPLPPPDLIDEAPELIEPGTEPLIGSMEAYYTNFYSAWSGYVILDPSGYSLVKGPFVLNQAATREVLSTLGEISTRISFSFRLERVFSTLPNQIYFDFITVSWPDGQQKIPSDHLPSTNNYISKVSGSIEEVDDQADGGLPAGLDILGCKVEIQ
jgi:hypothetical protein